MNYERGFKNFLQPGIYIDSDTPEIIEFAEKHAKGNTLKEKAISLFLAVRDGFWYDPYAVKLQPEAFKASTCVKEKNGYCITKSVVLAATSRVVGIPARLAFADVKNHLNSKQLRELMKTDVFYYHGYAELFLGEKWLKVTPAFNLELCEKFGFKPLEFDGENDCIYHPYDSIGKKHMEYIHFHGSFADVPFDKLVGGFQDHYPHIFASDGSMIVSGKFIEEVKAENKV